MSATVVAIADVLVRSIGPTVSPEAARSTGIARRWDAAGYLERNAEKAQLAEKLVLWLARSQVREYVSPKGYRMLIIEKKDPR